jgi:hypothetical protein
VKACGVGIELPCPEGIDRPHRATRCASHLTRNSALPDRTNLAAVARVIGRPYRELLSAALFDTGYLTDNRARNTSAT